MIAAIRFLLTYLRLLIMNTQHPAWFCHVNPSFCLSSGVHDCTAVGEKLSDEVLVICLERGANDLHVAQLMPRPPHSVLLR